MLVLVAEACISNRPCGVEACKDGIEFLRYAHLHCTDINQTNASFIATCRYLLPFVVNKDVHVYITSTGRDHMINPMINVNLR